MSNILELPLITLELPDYLEDLWGNTDKAVVSQAKGNKIAQLQGNADRFCHLEILPRDMKALPPRKEDLVVVWRLNEWKRHYEFEYKQKAAQDRRVREYELRKDILDNLERRVMAILNVPPDVANPIAVELVTSRNVDAARIVYGVDITPILDIETSTVYKVGRGDNLKRI